MLNIERLIWDDWNVAHIARHSVTSDEVEAACHGQTVTSGTYWGRIRIIGRTPRGRILTIILAPQREGVYYTVTARPASRQERNRYRQHQGDQEP